MLIGSPQALFVWPPLLTGLMLPFSTICILSCLPFCAIKPVKGRGTCFIPKMLNNKGPSQDFSLFPARLPASVTCCRRLDKSKCSCATGKCKFWAFGHNLFKVAGLSDSYLSHEVAGLSGFLSVGLHAFHLCSFCVSVSGLICVNALSAKSSRPSGSQTRELVPELW